jgi:hypothetical protein
MSAAHFPCPEIVMSQSFAQLKQARSGRSTSARQDEQGEYGLSSKIHTVSEPNSCPVASKDGTSLLQEAQPPTSSVIKTHVPQDMNLDSSTVVVKDKTNASNRSETPPSPSINPDARSDTTLVEEVQGLDERYGLYAALPRNLYVKQTLSSGRGIFTSQKLSAGRGEF